MFRYLSYHELPADSSSVYRKNDFGGKRTKTAVPSPRYTPPRTPRGTQGSARGRGQSEEINQLPHQLSGSLRGFIGEAS